MNYFNKLTSGTSEESSKRFISLFGLLLFTVCTIALIAGKTLPDSLIWALVAMITGQQALTMVGKPSIRTEQSTKTEIKTETKTNLKPDQEDENRN